MKKAVHKGASTVLFESPVYFESAAAIGGPKEGEGPMGSFLDMVCPDPMFGCDTWEAAESTLQKETALLALNRAKLHPEDISIHVSANSVVPEVWCLSQASLTP